MTFQNNLSQPFNPTKMSQENFLDIRSSLKQSDEISSIRAKIIGVGGAGVSLIDGLRFDNFDAVDNLAIDVD